MKCPNPLCGSDDTHVLETRYPIRRCECNNCLIRWRERIVVEKIYVSAAPMELWNEVPSADVVEDRPSKWLRERFQELDDMVPK